MGQIVGNITSAWAAPLQYEQDKARVYAARKMQSASNDREVAVNNLQNTVRSMANQARMEAGGEQVNAIAQTTARWLDAWTQGNINEQIGAAEVAGGLSVGAAAAGQGGGSIDLIKRTLAASQARAAAGREVTRDYTTGDAVDRQKGVMKEAVLGMDNSRNFANLDYTQYIDPVKPQSFSHALTTAVLSGGWSLAVGDGSDMVRAAQQGEVQRGAQQYGQRLGQTLESAFKIVSGLAALPSSDIATPEGSVINGYQGQPYTGPAVPTYTGPAVTNSFGGSRGYNPLYNQTRGAGAVLGI